MRDAFRKQTRFKFAITFPTRSRFNPIHQRQFMKYQPTQPRVNSARALHRKFRNSNYKFRDIIYLKAPKSWGIAAEFSRAASGNACGKIRSSDLSLRADLMPNASTVQFTRISLAPIFRNIRASSS